MANSLHACLQVRYTLQILYPVTVPEAVHRCDKQVMAKRDELRAFERTFTAAQVLLDMMYRLQSVRCRSTRLTGCCDLPVCAHQTRVYEQAEYAAALDAFAAHRKGLDDLLEERNEV